MSWIHNKLAIEFGGVLAMQIIRLLIPLVPGLLFVSFDLMPNSDENALSGISDTDVEMVYAAAADRMRQIPTHFPGARIESTRDAWSFFAFLARNRGFSSQGPLAAMTSDHLLSCLRNFPDVLVAQYGAKFEQLIGLLNVVISENARAGNEQQERRVWIPGHVATDEEISSYSRWSWNNL